MYFHNGITLSLRYLMVCSRPKLSEILPAAYYGRVESLFVAIDQEQWGSFDAATNTLQLRQEAEPGDVDLLDVAATQTFLHGGAVYALNWTEVPGEALAAAVFRY